MTSIDNIDDDFKSLILSDRNEASVITNRLNYIVSKYSHVSVYNKEYKRFKSFQYNNKDIEEYLFCLKRNY